MNISSKTYAHASITNAAATALIQAARAACGDLGIEVSIAVTDNAGHLKAFERSDKARFLTAEVAIDKAWTAASFGLATHVWASIIGNSAVAQLAHRPRLVAVGGGYPILVEGQVVGGLGISGGDALQDQQSCEIALKTTGFDLPE
jgi:uncharacterized protein GlcG (DUF336 family)